MNKETILALTMGLLVGVAATLIVTGSHHGDKGVQENVISYTESQMTHGSMSMDDMTADLKNKTGDEFDKAFIELMIEHHQGAIDMANLIPTQAKHEELKKLGTDIITAQTKEIEMMKQWLKDWGYEENGHMMDHSMMQ